jgi:hypothetical protein
MVQFQTGPFSVDGHCAVLRRILWKFYLKIGGALGHFALGHFAEE